MIMYIEAYVLYRFESVLGGFESSVTTDKCIIFDCAKKIPKAFSRQEGHNFLQSTTKRTLSQRCQEYYVCLR